MIVTGYYGVVNNMLLVLMYHHANANIAEHLQYLRNNFSIVVPGAMLPSAKLAVCLTFDDAYVDFYYIVYPLLRKFRIQALLAVAVATISEEAGKYCNWRQLGEMVASGYVKIVSHSYSHPNFANANVDLVQEIVQSKAILEQKLGQGIETFVYPFGKTTAEAQKLVLANYKYSMRIGSALNWNWHNRGYIYRVDAERYWSYNKFLNRLDYCKYFIKYLSNILRGK